MLILYIFIVTYLRRFCLSNYVQLKKMYIKYFSIWNNKVNRSWQSYICFLNEWLIPKINTKTFTTMRRLANKQYVKFSVCRKLFYQSIINTTFFIFVSTFLIFLWRIVIKFYEYYRYLLLKLKLVTFDPDDSVNVV